MKQQQLTGAARLVIEREVINLALAVVLKEFGDRMAALVRRRGVQLWPIHDEP